MKNLLTFFFLFFSSSLIAETYACSQELSRYNRPGEVETQTYERNGNLFIHNNGWEFYIVVDSKKELILLDYGIGSHFYSHVVMIDKENLEFTENYLHLEDSKENENEPLVYGKCVVTNS